MLSFAVRSLTDASAEHRGPTITDLPRSQQDHLAQRVHSDPAAITGQWPGSSRCALRPGARSSRVHQKPWRHALPLGLAWSFHRRRGLESKFKARSVATNRLRPVASGRAGGKNPGVLCHALDYLQICRWTGRCRKAIAVDLDRSTSITTTRASCRAMGSRRRQTAGSLGTTAR